MPVYLTVQFHRRIRLKAANQISAKIDGTTVKSAQCTNDKGKNPHERLNTISDREQFFETSADTVLWLDC